MGLERSGHLVKRRPANPVFEDGQDLPTERLALGNRGDNLSRREFHPLLGDAERRLIRLGVPVQPDHQGIGKPPTFVLTEHPRRLPTPDHVNLPGRRSLTPGIIAVPSAWRSPPEPSRGPGSRLFALLIKLR